MTSSGLKRPLDAELSYLSKTECDLRSDDLEDYDGLTPSRASDSSKSGSSVSPTSKRRCTDEHDSPSSFQMDRNCNSSSPNRDSSANRKYAALRQDIASMIQSELSRTPSSNSSNMSTSPSDATDRQQIKMEDDDGKSSPTTQSTSQQSHTPGHNHSDLIDSDYNKHQNNGPVCNEDKPVLTIRQAQLICEKLIREREIKIREEYDRKLAAKLAEHIEQSLAKSTRSSYERVSPVSATPSLAPLPTRATNATPHHAAAAAAAAAAALQHSSSPGHANSMNALAAAITSMQRSAAAAAVAAATNPMTDLSGFAASLSAANGAHNPHHHPHHHSNGLTNPHHQLAYNLQQQAAAAAMHQAQHQAAHRAASAAAVAAAAAASSTVAGPQAGVAGAASIPAGPVLLASNLDEQLATPEALFTLFGVFGDVIRVKILFNKKDNALVQMADANQAQMAQMYLDKQRVFGKTLRVTRSKHQVVQMPREGNLADAGLTKDFTNSPVHRFKIPGSRNYLNIYPPSQTLHISNIPATVEESDLRHAFKVACGFECQSFKFFAKDRKMALMKFDTIEQATIALIKMHNRQISEENNLRVSFSKSIMQR